MTEAETIEHACLRLQALYCRAADRGDIEGFVALFSPDAWITVPEHPPFVGHEAIRNSIRALAASGVTHRHVCTNGIVYAESATRATGSCYLIVFNSTAPADAAGWRPMDLPATVGEYDDTYVRTGEGWRIQSRVLTRVFRRQDDPILAAARNA